MLGDTLYARLKGQLGAIRTLYRFVAAGGFAVAWLVATLILRLVS